MGNKFGEHSIRHGCIEMLHPTSVRTLAKRRRKVAAPLPRFSQRINLVSKTVLLARWQREGARLESWAGFWGYCMATIMRDFSLRIFAHLVRLAVRFHANLLVVEPEDPEASFDERMPNDICRPLARTIRQISGRALIGPVAQATGLEPLRWEPND